MDEGVRDAEESSSSSLPSPMRRAAGAAPIDRAGGRVVGGLGMDWPFVILTGLVVGGLSGLLMGSTGGNLVGDIVLGLFGLVTGAMLFNRLGVSVYGLLGQILTGVVGASILIWLYHGIVG